MKQINVFQSAGRFKLVSFFVLLSTLLFSFNCKLKADYYVTGPTLICSSGQFTVQNYNNEPLVWSCSNSNLTLTSTQGQNPATFSYNGNGPGIVIATMTCNGIQYVTYHDFWAGVPEAPYMVSSETAMWGSAGNWYGFAVWPANLPSIEGAVPILNGGDDSYYIGGNYFHLYFGYQGLYQVWATFENTCGQSGSSEYLRYGGPYDGIDFGFEVLP